MHRLTWDLDGAGGDTVQVHYADARLRLIPSLTDPVVLIDTRKADQPITQVGFVVLHPEGGIVISDRYARQLFFLSTSGSIRKSWGQPGDGPAEFQAITWMGMDGDGRILVWDRSRARMTAWTRDGRLLAEGRVPPWIVQMGGRPTGAVADGRVPFVQPAMLDLGTMEPGKPFATRVDVRLWDWGDQDPAPRAPAAVVAGPVQELFVGQAAGGGYRLARDILFSAETLVAGDGHHLVLLDTDRGEAWVVDLLAPERSRLVDLILAAGGRRPVREDELQAEREARLADDSGTRFPVRGARQAVENAIGALSARPFRPEVGDLRMAPAPGSVLVAEYRSAYETKRDADMTTWCQWSTDSMTLAYCIELPSSLDLVGVRDGAAVVLEQADDGFQRLLRLGTTPARPSQDGRVPHQPQP